MDEEDVRMVLEARRLHKMLADRCVNDLHLKFPNDLFIPFRYHIGKNCLRNYTAIDSDTGIPIICIDGKCDYVMRDRDMDEYNFEISIYHKLIGSTLTPRLLDNWICDAVPIDRCKYGEWEPRGILILEKFDGILGDLISMKINPMELDDVMKQIYAKSLQLNLEYRVHHGDFNPSNILYKRTVDGILRIAFIDFDPCYTKINTDSYNPYEDLINLENLLLEDYGFEFQFPIPSEYRD
jgi:hypothetical protein